MAFRSWSRVAFALWLLSHSASSLVINNLRDKSAVATKGGQVQRRITNRITPVMVSMAADPAKDIKAKTVVAKSDPYEKSLKEKIEVAVYLLIWYASSAIYNIHNKKALNLLDLPWFVATIQMGTGLLIFIPMWFLGLRESPTNTFKQFLGLFSSLRTVALYNTLTHIAGVIALGAGAVSFAHVVKATEPVFTAAISALFLKQFLPWQAYAALVPVCVGVAIASAKELGFNWYCLNAVMMANVFAAARAVFGKKQMCGDEECQVIMSPENYYAVLTIISFIMLIPLSGFMEGKGIINTLKGSAEFLKSGFSSWPDFGKSVMDVVMATTGKPATSAETSYQGFMYALFSGVMYYIYNEVSFRALDKVHPITHAVANTVKRVVIILSALLVFRNPLTPTGIAGTTMAIGGVFLYSLCQHWFKPKKN